ncbi:hypothetical protein GCM10009799_41290 [Nocardiopsis rhodophaea]|uniref:Ethanolamine utilization protein n=1 Tax=Nocardiopsis rhodophaea TaxID=280238 RepID=A0ABN2THA2_9ACTN
MTISKYTSDNAHWIQFGDAEVFIGDVLTEENSKSMGGGFACFLPEASMTWSPSYDEAIIVLAGKFTVDSKDSSATAGPGEMIWVEAGTSVTFRAGREKVWLAFATYPLWGTTTETQANSSALRPVTSPPSD